MQGAGNDFVVLSSLLDLGTSSNLTSYHLKLIADRHFGIGADQILTVDVHEGSEADFIYRIFNADGSEVEQCGNGARCIVKFLHDSGFINGNRVSLMTKAGVIYANVLDDNSIQVQMSSPKLNASFIGLNTRLFTKKKVNDQEIYLVPWNNCELHLAPVFMGNPHIVIEMNSINDLNLNEIVTHIEESNLLSKSVNLGFSKVLDSERIALRVFERGVGETLACGTGACAAAVCGIAKGILSKKNSIEVNLPGGILNISWSGDLNDSVFMSGPAREVFRGKITL